MFFFSNFIRGATSSHDINECPSSPQLGPSTQPKSNSSYQFPTDINFFPFDCPNVIIKPSNQISPISCSDSTTSSIFGTYDVVFASGNYSKYRAGNLELTKICQLYQDEYDAALKSQQKLSDSTDDLVYKPGVLKKIVMHFRNEYPSSKIWTRKHGGDWEDITNDMSAIISKIQFKVCRKKCSARENMDNSCGKHLIDLDCHKRFKKSKLESDRNESMIIVSLSRLIADLQIERDSLKSKVDSLQDKVEALQEELNKYKVIDSSDPPTTRDICQHVVSVSSDGQY